VHAETELRMKEALLHYVWQYQYFNKEGLSTTTGESVQVLHTGFYNTDAGPDFSESIIRIGTIEWAGHIEIHVKASEWLQHGHQHNPAYNGVILHVVWEEDSSITLPNGSALPTLELKQRVPADLLQKWETFLSNPYTIPCQPLFGYVSDIKKLSMLDRSLLHRLERKAEVVKKLYKATGNDWEETAYRLLAQNMGFKINSEAFLRLAEAMPLKLIRKHVDQPLQVEAFLFGQAGFLEMDTDEEYLQGLQREWSFLKKKYKLHDTGLSRHDWKYLRLRPANFPTVRLAQMAALLQQNPHIFSLFLNTESPAQLNKALQVEPSLYWQQHYDVGKTSKRQISGLGPDSLENILINTVTPLLVAYSHEKDQSVYLDRAIALLENLPAEDNKITRFWKELQLKLSHAADAQGSIELYNEFCMPRRCLQCTIGAAILKPGT
jgi:hypothetical protein